MKMLFKCFLISARNVLPYVLEVLGFCFVIGAAYVAIVSLVVTSK
jgi:hypothetical protein